MPAVDALQTALSTLARAPILFVGGLASALIVLPQTAAQLAGVPLAPTALQVLTYFITPLFLAGVLGMAHEALDGDTSLGTLVDRGRDRYVSMLLANIFETAIVFAFGLLFAIVGIVVAITVFGTAAAAEGAAAIGGVGVATVLFVVVVFGLLALAFVVVMFFLQFYPVAVVVEDAGPVDAFTRSYGVVRSNLLSTLGYSVITVVVGFLTSLPLTGFVIYRTLTSLESMQGGPPTGGAPAGGGFGAGAAPQLFSLPEVIGISLLSLVLSTLITTFVRTYAVAFFTRHTESPGAGDEDGGDRDAGSAPEPRASGEPGSRSAGEL